MAMTAPHPQSDARDAKVQESTQESTPHVTVVITNYNRKDDLRLAIHSIEGQRYPHRDIIVVDNISTDGSRQMLRDEFPGVELLEMEENLGMAGYSAGFEKARGEIIFQMDNDSQMPDPHVLEEVVQRFEQGSERLAAVACRVEEYDAQHDEVEALRAQDSRVGPIDSGGFHSGGVGFRKSLLDQAGHYHRSVFLYASEMFVEMKLLAHGFEVHFFPEILMLHKSSKVARSPQGVYFELRNRYWFLRRFGNLSHKLRFFPPMLVHDLVYSLFKGRFLTYLTSLRDGFGAMPDDLPPMPSQQPRFQERLEEFGSWFGPRALLGRIVKRAFS